MFGINKYAMIFFKKIKYMYLSLGLAKNSLKEYLLGKIFDLEARYLLTHRHILFSAKRDNIYTHMGKSEWIKNIISRATKTF